MGLQEEKGGGVLGMSYKKRIRDVGGGWMWVMGVGCQSAGGAG